MTPLEIAAVASRLLQFAGAAVLGGASLFFIYGVLPDRRARWPSQLVGIAAGFGALGTLGWLTAQAAEIGEGPLDAASVWSVATETGFGRVGLMRLGCFLVASTLALGRWRGQWLALAGLGAAASASFAWTGHGARDDGWTGVVHLASDVLHLLAASTWIGALAALAVMVWIASRGPGAGARQDTLNGLVRFSGIGVTVVAVLVASGLANSWFLVGVDGLGRMLTTPYGRLLLAKLALFGLMLGLAAANRYRLTPRLARALRDNGAADGTAYGPIVASVLTETALAVAVLALVSWMGTLSPPMDT